MMAPSSAAAIHGIIDCYFRLETETAILTVNFDRARAAGLMAIGKHRNVVRLSGADEIEAAARKFLSDSTRRWQPLEKRIATDSLAALRAVAAQINAQRGKRNR